jgi:signal peptidase I
VSNQVSKSIISSGLDFLEYLLIAVSLFILVYLFVGQLLEVTGDSMYPTFKDKEQIIAEKLSISLNTVKRGEIIIFKSPKEPDRLLIKRAIALPGETITINNGKVFINGNELDEPYLNNSVGTFGGKTMEENVEYKIADDAYVFLGDNREKSTDSRDYGAVKHGMLVGRGIIVYFPLSSLRMIKN